MFLLEPLYPQEKEAGAAPALAGQPSHPRPRMGKITVTLDVGIFTQGGKLKPLGWREQRARTAPRKPQCGRGWGEAGTGEAGVQECAGHCSQVGGSLGEPIKLSSGAQSADIY